MKKFDWLIAAILYLVILCIFFRNIVPHAATALAGGDNDVFQYVWNFWHFKQSWLAGANPFFTDRIFYPLHISLILHVITPVKSAMALLLLNHFNLIATYNILFAFTLVTAGLGMYCLVKAFFGDSRVAFLAGFLFAFAPNHMAHSLAHFNVVSMEAIPWILFVWHLQQRQPSKIKLALLSGLGVYLFLCDYQLFFYLCIVAVGYIVFLASIRSADWLKISKQLAAVLAGFILALTPFWWTAFVSLRGYSIMCLHEPGFWASKIYCADLLSFFMPSELHPWWGKAITRFYDTFRVQANQGVGYSNLFERNVTLGFALTGLAAVGAKKYWKERYIRFWFWIGLAFALLALGPVVYFQGISLNYHPHWFFKVIFPTPYFLIHYLPIVNGMRIPARFSVITLLAAIMIASFVLVKFFSAAGRSQLAKNALFGLVLACVIFEYWPALYPSRDLTIPDVYDVIKQDKQKKHVVLDLPCPPWTYDYHPLYYQTYHGHALVGGVTARYSQAQDQYIQNYGEIKKISEDDPNADPGRFREILTRLDVHYVVARGATARSCMNKIEKRMPELKFVRESKGEGEAALWVVAPVSPSPSK